MFCEQVSDLDALRGFCRRAALPSDGPDEYSAYCQTDHGIYRFRFILCKGDYIRYDGSCWQETKPGAQAVAHALTDLQLEEAENAMSEATKRLSDTGAQALLDMNSRKKAEAMMSDAQRDAFAEFLQAESYRSYVL